MTIGEARALIPPGWVECDEKTWSRSTPSMSIAFDYVDNLYAIPAPKEPRRVPCGEMVISFDPHGSCIAAPDHVFNIRYAFGGPKAVANTKWTLDFDRREWVEVVE